MSGVKTHIQQDDLYKIETTESKAKEELHDRLERMVADVEDVINSRNQPEPQPPMDMEMDEL